VSRPKLWLEIDWDAPDAGVEALAAYMRNLRGGDPVELAVASGPLSEEEAGDRFIALARGCAPIAERWQWLPDIVIYAGGVPEDVPASDRLPGEGLRTAQRLRSELARYVVVTPVLNQVEWARGFEPEPGFRHLIVDNASDDGTADVLAERGADVVRESERLGRVDNWRRAARRFLEHTDAEWMKWLFAGDWLAPGAAGVIDRVLAGAPGVKLVAFEYEWRRPDMLVMPYRSLETTRVVEPVESAERFAMQGNWLGGPVALLLHREVVAGLEFGHHPFVADWQASMEIALRGPVLYAAEGPIGTFDQSRVRYHNEHAQDLYTVVQDVAMRYQALERFIELAPERDVSEHRRILDEMTVGRIAQRAQPSAPPPPPRQRSGGSKKRSRR
jgi:hypothetical protein